MKNAQCVEYVKNATNAHFLIGFSYAMQGDIDKIVCIMLSTEYLLRPNASGVIARYAQHLQSLGSPSVDNLGSQNHQYRE